VRTILGETTAKFYVQSELRDIIYDRAREIEYEAPISHIETKAVSAASTLTTISMPDEFVKLVSLTQAESDNQHGIPFDLVELPYLLEQRAYESEAAQTATNTRLMAYGDLSGSGDFKLEVFPRLVTGKVYHLKFIETSVDDMKV
jgi:hypothetical protein